MKLCDRCFQGGQYRPGPYVVKMDIEEFDLCGTCKESLKKFMMGDIIGAVVEDSTKESQPKHKSKKKS